MIRIEKVRIQNLGGVIDQTIEFPLGCNIVLGENYEDSGQKSNGAGKSLILEALYFGCTGEFLRKMARNISLIRDGQDSTTVTIFFSDFEGNNFLTIQRELLRRGGQKIVLLEGKNKNSLDRSGVDSYNKTILELLGVTKNNLLNYFFVHKEKYSSFLFGKEGEKRDLILDISGASDLDKIRESVSQSEKDEELLFKETESQINNYDKELNRGQLKVKELKETISPQKLKIKFAQERESKKSLLSEISNLKEQLPNLILRKSVGASRLINLVSWEDRMSFPTKDSLERLTQAQEILSEVNADILKVKTDLLKHERERSSLASKLSGSVSCPNCQHKFNPLNKEFSFDKGTQELTKIKNKIVELEESQKVFLSEKEETEEYIQDIKNELAAIERKKDKFRLSIKLYGSYIREIEKDIENINKIIKAKSDQHNSPSNEETYIETIKTQISEIEEENTQLGQKMFMLKKALDVREKKLLKFKFWKGILKRFEIYLINSTVELISQITNYYLSEMGSSLSIQIEGYRLLSDGKTIREEVTPYIFRDNEGISDIGRLSSGEKIRLIVANLRAFQEIINSQNSAGGLRYLHLDEIMESLDVEGADSLVESLGKVSDMTINLVTHTSNNKMLSMNNIISRKLKEKGIIYETKKS